VGVGGGGGGGPPQREREREREETNIPLLLTPDGLLYHVTLLRRALEFDAEKLLDSPEEQKERARLFKEARKNLGVQVEQLFLPCLCLSP
jgi:hypothetical protein